MVNKNEGILFNLKVGFKFALIGFLTFAIILIPLSFILFGSIITSVDSDTITGVGVLPLLAIPIGWTLNGFFINRWEKWIFK